MPVAKDHPGVMLTLITVALLATIWLSLGLGSADVGYGDAASAIRSLFTSEQEVSPGTDVVLRIRLPRVLLGLIVGALLGISGVIMQAFFRNVMAGPYLVGVSSGAALGAVLAMLLGWSVHIWRFSAVPLAAFIGALAVVALVYTLNRRRGQLHTEGLLLTGIAIAAAISAIVSVLLITSRNSIHQVLFWLMGSLSAARWEHIELVLPYGVIGIGVAILLARDMDLLLWGDLSGASLGVNIERTRVALLAAASLMTAAAVAVSGII